jgi:hypothetical protein
VTLVSAAFHHLKQLGVLKAINGLWLGNYNSKSNIAIEEIAKEDWMPPIVS